jgi:hypothetical protein
MDWFNAWDAVPYPGPYREMESVEPPVGAASVSVWLIVAAIMLFAAAMWYRRRAVRHSLWCASVGRDVEVRLRRARVLSCSAFEDRTAVTCARRCRDRSFRVQWPPALPVLTRPGSRARVA